MVSARGRAAPEIRVRAGQPCSTRHPGGTGCATTVRVPKERSLHTRVGASGYALLRRRAADETGGNLSELVRRMLRYAATRMPRGWTG